MRSRISDLLSRVNTSKKGYKHNKLRDSDGSSDDEDQAEYERLESNK